MLMRQQIHSVRQGVMETATKGKRARAITVTSETIATLRAHRVKQNEERLKAGPAWRDEGRVFPNGAGGALSERTIKGDWDRSLRRWGLPHMHFHGLRHLHATYLLVAGVHPKVVSERLGHAPTAIAMEKYSHVTPGLQEGAALAFEAALKALTSAAKPAAEAGEERRRACHLLTRCKRAMCGVPRFGADRGRAWRMVFQARRGKTGGA